MKEDNLRKYLRADIEPKEETIKWLEDHTREFFMDSGMSFKDGKVYYSFARWANLKIYFHTDDIRIYWNDDKVMMQIKDDEPQTLTKDEFKKKYVEPAVIFFNSDFSRVYASKEMLDIFFAFCEEELNDDLNKKLVNKKSGDEE